jgi:hypothetical protein
MAEANKNPPDLFCGTQTVVCIERKNELKTLDDQKIQEYFPLLDVFGGRELKDTMRNMLGYQEK